jgi:hypothetical protein
MYTKRNVFDDDVFVAKGPDRPGQGDWQDFACSLRFPLW